MRRQCSTELSGRRIFCGLVSGTTVIIYWPAYKYVAGYNWHGVFSVFMRRHWVKLPSRTLVGLGLVTLSNNNLTRLLNSRCASAYTIQLPFRKDWLKLHVTYINTLIICYKDTSRLIALVNTARRPSTLFGSTLTDNRILPLLSSPCLASPGLAFPSPSSPFLLPPNSQCSMPRHKRIPEHSNCLSGGAFLKNQSTLRTSTYAFIRFCLV